jgi:hypothetical protein
VLGFCAELTHATHNRHRQKVNNKALIFIEIEIGIEIILVNLKENVRQYWQALKSARLLAR